MCWYVPGVHCLPLSDNVTDGMFLETDCVVAFDHAYGKVIIVVYPNPHLDGLAAKRESRTAAG